MTQIARKYNIDVSILSSDLITPHGREVWHDGR